MSSIRSCLGGYTASGPTDTATLERLKAEAWLQQGIVVMSPDELYDPADQWLAQAARNYATKRFGRRTGR